MKFAMLEKYNFRDMAFKCAQCSYCQVGHGACPTYKVKRLESYSGKGKMLITKALMLNRLKSKDALEGLRDAIFGCTLCGGCEEICQVDIPFVKIYQLMRSELRGLGFWPEGMNAARDTLLKFRNIQGQSQTERIDGWSYWHPNEGHLFKHQLKEAKTAFFMGCVSSFNAIPIQATISSTLIFDKLDEDYTFLGDEEQCCGAPLIMTGDFETAKKFADHNIQKLQELGVERVITNCPGCYRMWNQEYEELLGIKPPFETLYGYEYLARLMDEGKMNNLPNRLDATVTFHDGCDAGRNTGFFEEPRKILENIPGIDFVELPHNKSNCYCCGSGGVLRAYDEEFASRISKLKIQDIEDTRADWVISGCPSCVDFLQYQLPKWGSTKKSKDLAVLLGEAMGFTWDGLDDAYR
ncbi:(Fe-S)-binding protein [Candidatus Thorarchaeota archaeon]|nr:MAG: (Fe-S)-binding protein [Candidatus Thorarchaeota archaeon]